MTVFHSTSAGREETLSSSVQICIFSVCQVIYESMTKEVHQSPQEPKTAAQSKLPVDRVMFIFGTFAAMHRGVVVENARTLKDTDTDTWNKYVYICICFYWSLHITQSGESSFHPIPAAHAVCHGAWRRPSMAICKPSRNASRAPSWRPAWRLRATWSPFHEV